MLDNLTNRFSKVLKNIRGQSTLTEDNIKEALREVRLAAGAGYVYAICGTMRTMPGLSKSPAAERIGFDENGTMIGLS